MFSMIASKTVDGFISGVFMPMSDRAAGGFEFGML